MYLLVTHMFKKKKKNQPNPYFYIYEVQTHVLMLSVVFFSE